MDNINVNDLKKLSKKIIVDDREYCASFIPYPVEKDIYSKFEYINGLMNNIISITDDDLENLKRWIDQILSHKKNNNENYNSKEFFDSIGVTEIVIILVSLVKYINDRITYMSKIFVDDSQKKTMVSQ